MSLRLFIAEDEPPARQRLEQALAHVAPQARVVGHADSVQGTADWLAAHPAPDLLLLDIQLADGLSLELFEPEPCRMPVLVPVIFTTAYDRFALQAFRAMAVDYLLKPVSVEALAGALARFDGLRQHFAPDAARLTALMQTLQGRVSGHRQRLVGSVGDRFHLLPVDQLAYVVSLDKTSVAVSRDGARHDLEQPLGELEALLDPGAFFRANRQLLIAAQAVRSFGSGGRGRIQVQLAPDPGFEVLVSQERAGAFRDWLLR